VVATFVLCIALGSLAVSRASHIPAAALPAAAAALAMLLALLHPLLDQAAFAAHRVRVLMPDTTAGHRGFQAASVGLTLAVLAVPLALSGALLPLLFHDLRRRMGELGGAVGRLYAWNTLGSVLGALLGGHLLLRVLDLHHVYRIAVGAVVVAAMLLVRRASRSAAVRRAAWMTAIAVLLALGALPGWRPERLSTAHLRLRHGDATVYRNARALAEAQHARGVLFAADDPTTTVLVNDHETEEGQLSRALFTNGKSDGSLLPDYPTMALTGLVPCILADACRSAFVIGLGTGVTAGELAALESVETVEVAEISSAVMAALPLFDEGNQGASRNPKLTIRREDAYRTLLRSDRRFDVIASEPSHPWAIGVEMLYAREFLSAARARLAPGGVYAQWMHAYEMDDETLALVLRTYADSFSSAAVWFAAGSDLLLLGFEAADPVPNLARLDARLAQPDLRAGFLRAGVRSLPALLAHELVPAGVMTRSALPGPVHTLLHPRLAHQATAAFFRGDHARLPRFVSAAASARAATSGALARLVAAGRLDEDAFETVVRRVCETRDWECATLLSLWQHEYPGSPRPRALRQALAPAHEPHLTEARIDVLAALFGEGLSGPLDPESARRLTDHYQAYYHPGRPFRREALERSLERCPGAECKALHRRVQAWLDAEEGARDPSGEPR